MNISSFNQALSRVMEGRSPPPSRSQWRRYSVAVLAVASALVVKLLLNSVIEQESPFLIFFAPVLVSALYGGMRAGLLATFLATLLSDYFFLSPAYSFLNHDLGQNLQLLLFVVEGISISSIVGSLNSANQQTDLSKLEDLHHEESLYQCEERFGLLVEDVKDYAIFMISNDGQISSWNAGGERIFGYSEAEIIGQDLSCIFTSKDIHSGQPKRELYTAMALGQAYEEAHHVRQDGTIFWASGVVTALRDQAGNMRGFSKVVRDITERKQAEETLQKANDDLEAKVEYRTTELRNANKALQSEIVERQQKDKAIALHEYQLEKQKALVKAINLIRQQPLDLYAIFGTTTKEVCHLLEADRVAVYRFTPNWDGHFVAEFVTPGWVKLVGPESEKARVEDPYLQETQGGRYRNNETFTVDDIYKVGHQPCHIELLEQFQARAYAIVPILIKDRLWGLLAAYQNSGPRHWQAAEVDLLVQIGEQFGVAVRQTEFLTTIQAEVTKRKLAEEALQKANDDLEVKVEHRATELKNANKYLQSEIAERQQSQEALRLSDERLRLALQVNEAGTWDWDMVTQAFIWSNNHELLFGLTPGTFDGTYQAVLECIHPQDRQLTSQALTRAIESRTDYDQEYRIIWPDGSIHWLAVKGKVFYDRTAQAVRMVGLSVDITSLKRATEQIAASLKEKEVLLKEIHHRVKNNLQIISSLLNLQSGYVEDKNTIEILQQCENRIASMALIHEHLYQSQDLARIDFADYVKTLTANLFSSYGIQSGDISFLVDVDNISLSIDAAIPCGLIINELVSNSLQHAFSLGKKGKICIGLHADNNNQLTLSVRDNGIGFAENLDFKNLDSLGLQIVIALTNQLEGTIELNRNNGTEFEVKFIEIL
ncbi:MAG: PAS domain S-box protein [Gloeocapsa sp. UFS-A4-WI-NPMV-4B04]|nr:PAS domain S-box protein [Gloeocapsa sp. UFS-A4-WI-NPMV-4B04]